MDVLILYRFYARDINSDKVSIFMHFVQRAKVFTYPVKWVFIADNTAEPVVEFCQDYAVKNGFTDFVVWRTSVDNRVRRNGQPEPGFRIKHFTHCVTSMEAVDEFATDGSAILFCEDDYVYHEEALLKGTSMLMHKQTDFVSLYDGPSHYGAHMAAAAIRQDRPPYDLELVREYDHHWRTGDSCCFTYMATKAAIMLNRDTFFSLVDWGDSGLWKSMWMNGRSKLWTSVPALVYHENSVNFETKYWDELRTAVFHRKGV